MMYSLFESPPPPLCGRHMIVGEYEQSVVYKRYDRVGNGPDCVFETSSVIYRVNSILTCTATGETVMT